MCWATPRSRREMPKSAFSANSQAKVVAADILAALAKKEKFEARYRNTCWSLLAPDDDVKIGANYAPKDGKLDPSGSFVSQRGEAADVRKQNYQESIGWYDSITADMFAKTTAAEPPRRQAEDGTADTPGRPGGVARTTRPRPDWHCAEQIGLFPLSFRWRCVLLRGFGKRAK